MPAAMRQNSVIKRLLDEPYRFQFAQAVSLIVRWLGEHGVPPERALLDCLRFENSLSFAFPPGEVEAMVVVAEDRLLTEESLVQTLHSGQMPQFRITPSFMGFLGEAGALPFHYTERVAAYQSLSKDESPRAFLDLFSTRALSLFYEAWYKHRVELSIVDGTDAYLPLLLNLAGFRPGVEVNDAADIRDETIALYAGVLQQRPVPPVVLARVLTSFFQAPVAVEESVGFWSDLEPQEQCALGGVNAALGSNTILGARSWRPDLGARLSIGPLTRTQFDGFLPGATAALALAKMLTLFGDQMVTYEIRLVLQAEDVRQICLGGPDDSGTRLGLDSFLVTAAITGNRTDMSYNIAPMGRLPARQRHANDSMVLN